LPGPGLAQVGVSLNRHRACRWGGASPTATM